MLADSTEIMNRGMKCLTESLGVVDAEHFIALIIREKFDYTKWQREYFDSMKPDEFHESAKEYASTHPFQGNAEKL